MYFSFVAEKILVFSTYDAFTLISVSFIRVSQKEFCGGNHDAQVGNFVLPPFCFGVKQNSIGGGI